MLALGCLFPIVFFIGGAIGGAFVAGEQGSVWGAVGGLVIGLAIPAVMLVALGSARKNR